MSAEPLFEVHDGDEGSALAVRRHAIFREVNEAWRRYPALVDGLIDVVCECSSVDCVSALQLTAAEYDRVRAVATRFVVHAAHEAEPSTVVVEETDSYQVLEVRGEAAAVASRLDPRGR